MSNSQVGTIYQKIMEEVISGCVVTFEEEGVEKKLLDEVRATWQQKLSERTVAQMPWDPAPNLPPQQQTPAGSAQGSRAQQPAPQPGVPQNSTPVPMQQPPPQALNGGAQVKSEPSTSYDLQNLPQMNPEKIAFERANNNINEFKLARDQNTSIHAHAAAQAQAQGQKGMAPPNQQAQDEQRRRYQQQMMQQNNQQLRQQQQQQQQYRNSLGNAQTDGAGEWSSFVAKRRAAFLEGSADADASIRERVEQMDKELEGGGLMLPLSESKRQQKDSKKSKARSGDPLVLAQTDGPAGEFDDKNGIKDEEDEDAINSDLDDPDDDQIEETEDDGGSGEVMLCTYDKVQRVKNKWKCTLKDGVLSTGGKEYVFHKANGEFEW